MAVHDEQHKTSPCRDSETWFVVGCTYDLNEEARNVRSFEMHTQLLVGECSKGLEDKH
jgi:hypothetical protein